MRKIEAIKNYVDVGPFMQACGIALKMNGKGYKGHCPFHKDKKTPSLSVTPSKQLWKCFGCGKGGDVFTFVMEHEHLSFPDAARRVDTPAAVSLAGMPVRRADTLSVLAYGIIRRQPYLPYLHAGVQEFQLSSQQAQNGSCNHAHWQTTAPGHAQGPPVYHAQDSNL